MCNVQIANVLKRQSNHVLHALHIALDVDFDCCALSEWLADHSQLPCVRSGLCSVPEDSHLWAGLRLTASSGQSVSTGDCWLGHGWGQCRASLGMSHYPGLSSCYWWHAHLPSSLLQHIVRNSWKNIWN